MTEENAKIESVSLGSDDHGGLTCWLSLKYGGGSGQGFGGYDLRWWGGYYLKRVLEVVGVTFWEDCVGKVVRVRHTSQKVEAIGNATEDNWFAPGSDAERAAMLDRMRKVLNES